MLAYARSSTNGNGNGTNGKSTNATSLEDRQSIRLFFQSAYGNIKLTGYDGVLSPWRDAM